MSNPLHAPQWTQILLKFVYFLLYLPFLWMIVRSFGGPHEWGLHWYEQVLQNSTWMEALGRSCLVAIFASFFATLFGLGAALASRSKLARFLDLFSVVALVLPELVFALSLLTWFVTLKFELNLITLIMAHVTFSLSFAYFLILSRFRQIDRELIEAATDLGSSSFQTFRKVLLPLLLPSLGVSFLICFLISFDDFLISFFVSGAGADTLPIKLFAAIKMGLTPQLHALATLMSVFSSAALYLVLHSSFLKQLVSK